MFGDGDTSAAGDESESDQPSNGETPTDAAVTAEWNAIRTRLRDPVILGHAGEFAAGASVAARPRALAGGYTAR